jgi:hypothetical protein
MFFRPNFIAAEPVVSPMQAMELFQLSTFEISFNQALHHNDNNSKKKD